MKRTAIICALALLLVPCLAQPDIAEIMSYQGVLRDGSGNPVPDGSYDVTFRIYDIATGGTALWTENQTLTATGGIINAHLGSVEPLNTLGFDVPYWLGIAVEGGAELVPRTPFTTVPYAAHAGFADTCLEGDDDWQINGDDIHHDVGNVGIGTATPYVKLDVFTGDARCARFENSSGANRFTVTGVNYGGTAAGYFAGTSASSWPGVPAAVFGHGGAGYRGAHFTSDDDVALFAASPSGRAIWGYSTANYSGYFDGGGLGVYVDDVLETNAFRMQPGTSGYVLTSDGGGNGTWQPGGGGSDGDWTIVANDMYSGVPGRVGIGVVSPTAKLEIYNDTADEALEVKYGGATASRVVNIERMSMPASFNDLLQLKIPAGSPADCQFIEAEYGAAVNFSVDGDGSITSRGTLDVYGSDVNQAEFSSNSVTGATRVVSGIVTGTGYADPVGVYGESIPANGFGIGGKFVGGYYGVLGAVYPNSTSSYRAVYGHATEGATNYGVYGRATGGTTNWAGYFAGNAHVTGTFTAGTKSFKIDHPLDPENKYLVHSCVESDEMMNIYNGNATLDARGEAGVEMPEWFEALNQDFRYQLTCIGGFAPVYVAETIAGNRFIIAGGEPGMVVSWQVTGVRHDPLAVASRMLVEQDKPASEVGKYMHPEAYGMPVTAGVDYHEERELAASGGRTERRPLEAFDPNDGE
jgi:hypothetical protein